MTTRTVADARVEGRLRLMGAAQSPQLDADLILAHVRRSTREHLFASGDDILSAAQMVNFMSALDRRLGGESVPYITGTRSWYGLDIEVTRDVLVPRPETEILVEAALALTGSDLISRIVDVGTGSGAIAVALALQVPEAHVVATDISPAATVVARRNAIGHGLGDRVSILVGDLISQVVEEPDLVVANLPYVPLTDRDTLPREVRAEPEIAVFGGEDGLDVIERLLTAVRERRWKSDVLLEIDPRQADRLSASVRRLFPSASINTVQDLAGLDRVVVIERHTRDGNKAGRAGFDRTVS